MNALDKWKVSQKPSVPAIISSERSARRIINAACAGSAPTPPLSAWRADSSQSSASAGLAARTSAINPWTAADPEFLDATLDRIDAIQTAMLERFLGEMCDLIDIVFICCSCHNVQAGTPVYNILAMIDEVTSR